MTKIEFCRLLALVSIINLAACSWVWPPARNIDFSQLDSGEVSVGKMNKPLTQEQLMEVSHWLQQHHAGWQSILTPDPLPSAYVQLKHSDGKTSTLKLYSNRQGWSHSIRLERENIRENGGQHLSEQGLKLFNGLTVVALAAKDLAPEFLGDWVSQNASCKSDVRLRVGTETVTLINGADVQEFWDLDLCYNCEGGIRYSGDVVWLAPKTKKTRGPTFTIKFNSGERKGVTVVEFENQELQARFPVHMIELMKCSN